MFGRLNLKNIRTGASTLFNRQRKYVFNAYLNPPFINTIVNRFMPALPQLVDLFTYSVISTNIPGKERDFQVERFMDKTWTVPEGDDSDHKWECTLVQTELGHEIDIMRYWFDFTKIVRDIEEAKGSIRLDLLGSDGNSVNRTFILEGAYPLNKPEITGFNHEEKSGFSQFDISIAFDDIRYGLFDAAIDTVLDSGANTGNSFGG